MSTWPDVGADHCLKGNDYWMRSSPKRLWTYKRTDCCCTFRIRSNWTLVLALCAGLRLNCRNLSYCRSLDERLREGLAGDSRIDCKDCTVGRNRNGCKPQVASKEEEEVVVDGRRECFEAFV